jgi:hypothetical protein
MNGTSAYPTNGSTARSMRDEPERDSEMKLLMTICEALGESMSDLENRLLHVIMPLEAKGPANVPIASTNFGTEIRKLQEIHARLREIIARIVL